MIRERLYKTPRVAEEKYIKEERRKKKKSKNNAQKYFHGGQEKVAAKVQGSQII